MCMSQVSLLREEIEPHGCELSGKCCKTMKSPSTEVSQPPWSCGDTASVTWCPCARTGISTLSYSQALSFCFSQFVLLAHWECFPKDLTSLLLYTTLAGAPGQRQKSAAVHRVCQWTFNLSLPFTAAAQRLVSFSLSHAECFNAPRKSKGLRP